MPKFRLGIQLRVSDDILVLGGCLAKGLVVLDRLENGSLFGLLFRPVVSTTFLFDLACLDWTTMIGPTFLSPGGFLQLVMNRCIHAPFVIT